MSLTKKSSQTKSFKNSTLFDIVKNLGKATNDLHAIVFTSLLSRDDVVIVDCYLSTISPMFSRQFYNAFEPCLYVNYEHWRDRTPHNGCQHSWNGWFEVTSFLRQIESSSRFQLLDFRSYSQSCSDYGEFPFSDAGTHLGRATYNKLGTHNSVRIRCNMTRLRRFSFATPPVFSQISMCTLCLYRFICPTSAERYRISCLTSHLRQHEIVTYQRYCCSSELTIRAIQLSFKRKTLDRFLRVCVCTLMYIVHISEIGRVCSAKYETIVFTVMSNGRGSFKVCIKNIVRYIACANARMQTERTSCDWPQRILAMLIRNGPQLFNGSIIVVAYYINNHLPEWIRW